MWTGRRTYMSKAALHKNGCGVLSGNEIERLFTPPFYGSMSCLLGVMYATFGADADGPCFQRAQVDGGTTETLLAAAACSFQKVRRACRRSSFCWDGSTLTMDTTERTRRKRFGHTAYRQRLLSCTSRCKVYAYQALR